MIVGRSGGFTGFRILRNENDKLPGGDPASAVSRFIKPHNAPVVDQSR